jgi:hypothetical protein
MKWFSFHQATIIPMWESNERERVENCRNLEDQNLNEISEQEKPFLSEKANLEEKS